MKRDPNLQHRMWLHDSDCWMCGHKFIDITPEHEPTPAKCPKCKWRMVRRKDVICGFSEKALKSMARVIHTMNIEDGIRTPRS